MKKKEKKYYGKKKKFYSFFLKIFIPFIIVTSILGGIITAFLNLTFQNNISSNVQAAEKTIRQAGIKYWNIYQTELEEQKDADYEFQTPYDHYIGNMIYLNNLSMAALNDSEVVNMQGFIHLYQKDDAGNLTEITDQKDKVFLQINDTSENKYMLYCDNDIFEAAVPEIKDMSADFSLDKMNEVYVSGMQFYPASYTCFADGEEQKRTVSEIPDGYVKLDQSSEFTIPHGVVGCIPISLKVDRYTGTDEIVNDYQNNSNWEYVEDTEKCVYGTHAVYAFPVNNDNTAFAVIDYHYNIVKSLMGHMIIYIWLGVVLGSALISLVIAYIMYRSYKSAYDMEQYRRTTSNAMAHDLKSPLAVISLYAENLKSGKNPEKNQYYMDGILNEVKAMNEQVASILDMAKAEELTKGFSEALDNDLNTSLALTCVYDVLKADADDATKLYVIGEFDKVLSLDLTKVPESNKADADDDFAKEVEELIAQRTKARAEKDWATADAIRDKLKEMKVVVKDTKDGIEWHVEG